MAGTAFIQAIGRFMVDDGASIEAFAIEAIRRYAAGCDPEAVAGVEVLDA